ncbi:Helix-turn-helix domain-containing protein [Bacillus sp. OV194]|nr:Helix-turn-helix domain-containing protein [Bacillus sp. OV194]
MYQLEKDLGLTPKIHPIFEEIDDNMVLTPVEISQLIGMHPETVRAWCRNGNLVNYQFKGKYMVIGSDFKNFMRKSMIRGKAKKKFLQ